MNNNFLLDYPVNTTLKMHECGQNEYWFYHKGSYPNDNPLLYQELISKAKEEIIIWDPYFNIGNQIGNEEIFINVKFNTTIKVLTMKGLEHNDIYLTNFQNALRNIIPKNKDVRFGLRVINRGDSHNQGDCFFHDRFLIIDDNDVYLIGSSIEYHLKPQMSTGIFKVNNDDTKNFIKSIFEYYWNNFKNHEIPLTYLYPDP